MADYISKFTGEQIDSMLDQISVLLESINELTDVVSKSDLAYYIKLEDFKNKFDSLLEERKKVLSTKDLTVSLFDKLDALYSKLELDELLRKSSKYEILTYHSSKEQTRLQVDVGVRKYGLLISYYDGTSHITEKYIGTDFADESWQSDENWIDLGTLKIPAKPTVPGVYILDIDGEYTKWSLWNSADNESAVGVVVIDNLASFGIFLTSIGSLVWSNNASQVSGIVSSYDVEVLKSDFNGSYNTSQITLLQGASAVAAFNCQTRKTKDGRSGYLPSFGEWSVALKYIEDVNKAMTKVGGVLMPLYTDYWTSNQCPSGHAWTFRWCHGEHQCVDKRNKKEIRAFFKLD